MNFSEALERYESRSLIEVVHVTNFRPILAACIFIYFKYQTINIRLKQRANEGSQENWEDQIDRQLIIGGALMLQMVFGFLISHYFYGRIVILTFVVCILVFFLDIAILVLRLTLEDNFLFESIKSLD